MAVVRAATIFVGLVVTIVLAGWMFEFPVFKSVVPGLTTMKANTAICLGLTALGVWLARTREGRSRYYLVIYLLVGVVSLTAAITLSEYVFGWNAGIDELFFPDPEHLHTLYPPGRLAPGTAICFILLSGALVGWDAWPRFSHGLALTTVLVTLVATIGYLYNLPTLTEPGDIPQSQFTPFSVFLLSVPECWLLAPIEA